MVGFGRQGVARHGKLRYVGACFGTVGRGRHGLFRYDKFWWGPVRSGRYGQARFVGAACGEFRRGMVRHDMAGLVSWGLVVFVMVCCGPVRQAWPI
jgi:hypothetical protein